MEQLYNGDCLVELKHVPDSTVDLIITSPPYAKQRDYTGYRADEFDKFLMPIMQECMRVLKPTGNLVLNIKEHVDNGQRHLYVYKMVIMMVEQYGWRFTDEFVWNKTNPFPTGAKTRLKDGWERILHFTKSKSYKFFPENVLVKSESKWLESEKKRKNRGVHNTTNGSNMNMSRRIASDMVRPSNVLTMSTSNKNIGHPAVFPIGIPDFFIKLMTEKNDFVLDPFMGSGTTGISCAKLERNFIGIELDDVYFTLAKKLIEEERKCLII